MTNIWTTTSCSMSRNKSSMLIQSWAPPSTQWHVKTRWRWTVRKNSSKSSFQQLCSSKWAISLASLICEGCGLQNKRTIGKVKTSAVYDCITMTQWAEKVDIHTWESLLSDLQETSYWPMWSDLPGSLSVFLQGRSLGMRLISLISWYTATWILIILHVISYNQLS